VVFHQEVSIAAQKIRNLAVVPVTRCLVVGPMTNLTVPEPANEVRQDCRHPVNPVMKYVVIAALVSIVVVVIYARIRPYLKLARQVADSLNATGDVNSRKKLVRCEGCGTWIPAERALNLSSGLATFCSSECMAKQPVSKERKIAG
jgi:hypothetical protein